MLASRSSLIKKNIIFSFVLKFADGIIYLLVVPITLDFLDEYSYGIWLTINSILMWINTFDIGLGNGLRNYLSESLAKKDYYSARTYISTTYFLLFIVSLLLICLISGIINHVDWYGILNVNVKIINNLQSVIYYTFLCCLVTFVIKIIGNIYLSLQFPAISSFFSVLGNLSSLIIILILKQITHKGSLLNLSIIYTATPIVVYSIATLITFGFIYKELRPSIKLINLRKYGKKLFSTSSTFFIIQIAGLILLSMSNVIVSRLLGPESVSSYNIANRYMSISHMVIAIVLTPMWSAVTNAYVLNDVQWIRTSLSKIRKIVFLFVIVQFLLVLASPSVYKMWLSDNVNIPYSLTVLMGIYVYIISWSLAHSTILNGLGLLRQQLIVIIVEVCMFIPLSYYATMEWKLNGMCISMIIANIPAAVMNTIQVEKILNNKANGFWRK